MLSEPLQIKLRDVSWFVVCFSWPSDDQGAIFDGNGVRRDVFVDMHRVNLALQRVRVVLFRTMITKPKAVKARRVTIVPCYGNAIGVLLSKRLQNEG